MVGAEPWAVAVLLGSLPVLLGLGLSLWAIRRFDGRKRIYFATRGSLYVVLGVGLIAGHWGHALRVVAICASSPGWQPSGWRESYPRHPLGWRTGWRIGGIHRVWATQQARTRDGWEPDPWVWDDQSVIVRVKDKGFVVLSSCSHSRG